MPIQTYYDGSPKEDEDLLELREAHYDRLHALRLQAARYGDAVPAGIAAGIADAESQIRAIDEVRAASIRPETAEKIGQTGQFTVLASRLDLLMQQHRLSQEESEKWRIHFGEQLQNLSGVLAAETERWQANLAEQVKVIHGMIAAETDKWRDVQRGNWLLFQGIGALLLLLMAVVIVLLVVIALRK